MTSLFDRITAFIELLTHKFSFLGLCINEVSTIPSLINNKSLLVEEQAIIINETKAVCVLN
jgi:hypothetical protein